MPVNLDAPGVVGSLVYSQSTKPHAGVLGFTATPDFDERRKLAKHLPDLIHEIPMQEAIDWGIIAPYQTLILPTYGDLSQVMLSRGDYDQEQLNHALDTDPRNHLIARFVVESFLNEHVIVIVNVNYVNHAHKLAELIRFYGKQALAVSGKTKTLESSLEALNGGDITTLVQARILGEGFNSVRVSAVVNSMPTPSWVHQKQRVGRGQRIDPANPSKVLKVVECVDEKFAHLPVLYGDLTQAWEYGPGVQPFEPAPGYTVLQGEQISDWRAGSLHLPSSPPMALSAPRIYSPVEVKIFTAPTASSRKGHADEVTPIESIRSLAPEATLFVLDGRGDVSRLHPQQSRRALQALAGHPALDDPLIRDRYLHLQQVTAQQS